MNDECMDWTLQKGPVGFSNALALVRSQLWYNFGPKYKSSVLFPERFDKAQSKSDPA